MKKILIVFAAMAFLAFGFAPGAFASGIDKSMSSEAKDLIGDIKDASAWIGKDIKNSQGEDLGQVKDFVRDESGPISLVIVSHDEKSVAVPYSAFSFNETEDHAVLDVTRDQLASAPEVDPDENLADRAFAEEAYRHFGERPYWTEKDEAVDQGMKTEEGLDTREYYGIDEGVGEDFNVETHDYYGADEGINEGLDWPY